MLKGRKGDQLYLATQTLDVFKATIALAFVIVRVVAFILESGWQRQCQTSDHSAERDTHPTSQSFHAALRVGWERTNPCLAAKPSRIMQPSRLPPLTFALHCRLRYATQCVSYRTCRISSLLYSVIGKLRQCPT